MSSSLLFTLLIFLGVSVIVGLIVFAVFGRNRDPRLQQRISDVSTSENARIEGMNLVREKYLRQLSPFERSIETFPGLDKLAFLLEQTGRFIPAYRVVLLCFGIGLLAGFIALLFSKSLITALVFFILVSPLPILKLIKDRNERFEKFEEQLPDALDVMGRAMRAGNPFNEALKFVAEEMDDPIASEFATTFSDINYGVNVNVALGALLSRVQSVSLAALVTAILVQRETGGNLAEILDKISDVIRGRFRFYRRVRVLTAEGRLSAWVLVLFPFLMCGVLTLTAPSYLPIMFEDPLGVKLIIGSLGLMAFGIFWIRRTIRIEV